jgi:two-component system cell cycle response regulator DivK
VAIPEPPPAAPGRARQCVLVVEDDPFNMKLFSAMVGSQGYDVLQAVDGRSALDLARRHHPDLIIMDLKLPDMSGLDVTRSLKADAATRDIAIVATTAHALRGDEGEIQASGCDGYMAKPIAVSDFLELIEELITEPPTPLRLAASRFRTAALRRHRQKSRRSP